jgi:hypothetical protein
MINGPGPELRVIKSAQRASKLFLAGALRCLSFFCSARRLFSSLAILVIVVGATTERPTFT